MSVSPKLHHRFVIRYYVIVLPGIELSLMHILSYRTVS